MSQLQKIALRIKPQDVIEQRVCKSVVLLGDRRSRHSGVDVLLVAEEHRGE